MEGFIFSIDEPQRGVPLVACISRIRLNILNGGSLHLLDHLYFIYMEA